jgi:hypothetical protein
VSALELAVLLLAVHRVAHFVTEDQFPAVVALRNRVNLRWPLGWPSYLVGCFWCVSVWASGAVTLAAWAFTPGLQLPWLVWLALSSAASAFETLVEAVEGFIKPGDGS